MQVNNQPTRLSSRRRQSPFVERLDEDESKMPMQSPSRSRYRREAALVKPSLTPSTPRTPRLRAQAKIARAGNVLG